MEHNASNASRCYLRPFNIGRVLMAESAEGHRPTREQTFEALAIGMAMHIDETAHEAEQNREPKQ